MKKDSDLWTRLNPTKKKLLTELKIALFIILLNVPNLSAITLADPQQQILVTGTITDATTGQPMVGVNISVRGTTTGVITDANGKYSLTSPVDREAFLIFSFIGYTSQEIAVAGRTVIDVALASGISALEEVVVVGYGTTKKATVTGAISTVSGTSLQSAPTINFSNALAGRLPGLVSVSRSGEPGRDGATLRIRGVNTLGDNSPLVVIDGIANRDLNGINSEDVESITVLKDASAAIYGAQAANGVILITTKRGTVGKPLFTVTYNQGVSAPTVLPKMADAPTYATMVNEVQSYRNNPPQYTAEQIQAYGDGSDPWLYPNTDWFADTYKPTSAYNNANMMLTGGSDKLKYFFSLGYRYQDGNYRNSATNYSQFNFRSNIDGKVTDNITIGIDFAGRQENRNYPTRDAGTIFGSAMRSFPTMPSYWPNGLPGPDIERGENPVVMATSATGYDKSILYVMESNLRLGINIPWVKGLSLNGNASIDKNIGNGKLWQTPYMLYGWDRTTYDENGVPVLTGGYKYYSEPRLTQRMSDSQRTTLNGLINYERTFSNHFVKVLAGVERIEGYAMNFWAFRRYYVSTVSQQLFAGGDLEKDNNGSASNSARMSYFGRFNYSYLNKYLAEFVWRYDGSYIFPSASRFGFFPTVSLGWKISEEAFWQDNITAIGSFKIRGSWGQTGNDRIEPYQYLSSYGYSSPYIFNQNLEVKTLAELRIPNENVTWEVANQSNIGFDAVMFDDKFNVSFDYFYNLRENILWQRNASVPGSTGLSLPRENIGKVKNSGVEVLFGYKNTAGSFSYQFSLNGAYQKDEILFWDETPGVPEYQKSTGRPMNSRLLYQSIGVFKDQAAVDAYPHWENARPGDIIFKDVNNDGEINALDQVRNDKTDLPRFTGGFDANLAYKNFYANILFQGAAGATTIHYSNSGLFGNFMQQDADGRWTEENPSSTKPRAWNFSEEYWMADYDINNTYFLRSTDYLRLKNIEIGYNLPATINKKLGIEGLRIFVSGTNLLTFTKLLDYDPETSGYSQYPPVKVYNAGISLTF
jgi:TonB-linked SusC/RagA family outer membrane protein